MPSAREYFDEQEGSTREFWQRFGRVPDVAGKRVLDIGCGHGAMSIALAQQGATVVGVDPESARIEWAQRNLTENYPQLADRVTFLACESPQLPSDDRFDLAVCKDTFEHVQDVTGLLVDLWNRLQPDGEFWVGFSPLYFSPRGDHGRVGLRLPWAHVLLPGRLILWSARRVYERPVRDLDDMGLNRLTPAQFRQSFAQSGMTIRWISYNRGDKPLLKMMSYARCLPGLDRYMTVSMYAVLARQPTV